jgi:hypothetical protein
VAPTTAPPALRLRFAADARRLRSCRCGRRLDGGISLVLGEVSGHRRYRASLNRCKQRFGNDCRWLAASAAAAAMPRLCRSTIDLAARSLTARADSLAGNKRCRRKFGSNASDDRRRGHFSRLGRRGTRRRALDLAAAPAAALCWRFAGNVSRHCASGSMS